MTALTLQRKWLVTALRRGRDGHLSAISGLLPSTASHLKASPFGPELLRLLCPRCLTSREVTKIPRSFYNAILSDVACLRTLRDVTLPAWRMALPNRSGSWVTVVLPISG